MVKPAMPYLDLISEARQEVRRPHRGIPGERGILSMIMAAARNGWLDHDRAMMEIADLDHTGRARDHSDVLREARGTAAGLRRAVRQLIRQSGLKSAKFESTDP